MGIEKYLTEIKEELMDGKYKPSPVRRVMIPKPDGSKRPLGIPTVKDRIVQMATKIAIEPVFEADFRECSYGFRPKSADIEEVEETSEGGFGGATTTIVRTAKTESVSSLFCCLNLTNQRNSIK